MMIQEGSPRRFGVAVVLAVLLTLSAASAIAQTGTPLWICTEEALEEYWIPTFGEEWGEWLQWVHCFGAT